MKFTSRDYHTLRQAADVADAQRELVELIKRRENPPDSWQAEAGIIGAALAVILVVTVAALTQAPASGPLAYDEAPPQQVVSRN
jgi:hypothetical protein